MTRYYTQSELQTWLRCRRRWWLSVHRALRVRSALPYGALALGTHVHEALAEQETMGTAADYVLHRIYDEVVSCLDETEVGLIERVEKDRELAVLMVQGYNEWVAETGVNAGLRVVGVEEKVAVDLTPTWGLLGKLDVRIMDENGHRRFRDYKTVGSIDASLKTLHMDFQMLTYHLLEYLDAVQRGEDPTSNVVCDGGHYTMLRKVKRTVKANPPFYHDEIVPHNVIEVRNFYTRVMGIIMGQIRPVEVSLRSGGDHQELVPPTWTARCSWDCEFRLVCPLFDDGSDAEGWLREFTIGYDPLERYAERGDEDGGH